MQRARQAACANNVRQLGDALQLFVANNHAYPLVGNKNYNNGDYPDHYENWEFALDHELGGEPNTHDAAFLSKGIWKCPAAKRPAKWPKNTGYESYGYNAYGVWNFSRDRNAGTIANYDSFGIGREFGNFHLGASPPVQQSEVVSPSSMIALGDGFCGNNTFVEGGISLFERMKELPMAFDTKEPFARHQGRANAAFCDGHVEAPTLSSLFIDTNDVALSRWNRDHQPHRENL
jgi:prepilin-type processing-associated H-X9-DG protein